MSAAVAAGIVAAMTAFRIASGARRFGWQAVDIAAASLLTSIAVAEVVSAGHATPPAVVAAAVFTASVGWCRRAPTAAVCVGLLCGAMLVVIGGIDLAVTPLVTVVVYFMLGRVSAAGRRLPADVLLVVLPVPLVAAGPGTSHVVDVASVWLFFFAAPFAAGWWVGRGTLLASELRENVDELAFQQQQRARRAASEERARIARELHDVVAHNISVMVVQTQAARRVAAGDLAAAGSALQAVSDCGRDALVDMRRMIGVLHRGDVELAAPGLARLPALVERAEASGLRVALQVSGATRPLPPSVDLASYRLVQEALTNVIKHASAARVCIRVVHPPGAVELDISDDGCGLQPAGGVEHAAGHGLIGMRERLALYGGEMHAGSRPGGGFRLTARIPIDEDRLA
jgi:signal transduction histidine kinase